MHEAVLTRLDGVELAREGRWPTSTGIWDAAPEDFAAAIAALQCPAVDKPRLWIGHTDQRFTPRTVQAGDGEPTIGWIENMHLSDQGHTLVGDYVGVPRWLGDIMASAYPRRSIEGSYNRRCALGHRHPFVIDGVSLLGVTRPGVGTLRPLSDLDDVKQLYGLTASADPDPCEVRIAATITGDTVRAHLPGQHDQGSHGDKQSAGRRQTVDDLAKTYGDVYDEAAFGGDGAVVVHDNGEAMIRYGAEPSGFTVFADGLTADDLDDLADLLDWAASSDRDLTEEASPNGMIDWGGVGETGLLVGYGPDGSVRVWSPDSDDAANFEPADAVELIDAARRMAVRADEVAGVAASTRVRRPINAAISGDVVLAHLPGKHDQDNHGDKGSSAGSVAATKTSTAAPAVIFQRAFKMGGNTIVVTAHTDGSRTLDFGAIGSVNLTPSELAAKRGVSLRGLAFDAQSWQVGESGTLHRRNIVADDTGRRSLHTRLLLAVKKVGDPPDAGGDEETWDQTPLSVHLPPNDDPSQDELVGSPGVQMRQRDLVRLAEQANGMVAERIGDGDNAVDVIRDGGRYLLRPVGGPELRLDRGSLKALDGAMADLYDDENRDKRPAGEVAEVAVDTNVGPVTVRMWGEADRVEIRTSDGVITVTGSNNYLAFSDALEKLLGSVAAAVGPPVAAAADVHSGAMVALIPFEEDAARLSVEGGEPADQLHVTLAYLGDAVTLDAAARQDLIDAVSTAVNGAPVIEADGFAVSIFNPPGVTKADGKQRDTCIVVGWSGDDLDLIHTLVGDALEHSGVALPSQHAPWHAHTTLLYTDDLSQAVALADRAGPARFDRIRIALAGQHVDIPLIDVPEPAEEFDPDTDDAEFVAAAEGDENSLREFFTRNPRGLARWKNKRHPWTALFRILTKHVGAERARRIATSWFHRVFGYYPGDKRHRSKVAAQIGDTMPNPQPDLPEKVRQAWNNSKPYAQWIVRVDDNTVLACDEDNSRAFTRVPFTLDGDVVTFGEPEALDGVPVAAMAAVGGTVYASHAESRPRWVPARLRGGPRSQAADVAATQPEGEPATAVAPDSPAAEPEPNTEPKEDPVSTSLSDVRSRLGLPDDADEAAVTTAVLAELDKQAVPQSTPEQVAAAAAAEEKVAAAEAEKQDLAKEVQVLASQVQEMSTKLAAAETAKAATVKASVLDEAQKLGKFTPAAREQWEKDYDEAPAAVTRVLAAIAPGTAVPVTVAGESGGAPDGDLDAEWKQYEGLFPPETANAGQEG
ncbi:MAG TPA: phage protease [Candidatus Limnocylindrales bacterium]